MNSNPWEQSYRRVNTIVDKMLASFIKEVDQDNYDPMFVKGAVSALNMVLYDLDIVAKDNGLDLEESQ